MIIWAGTSNKDVGMIIEHYPSVIFPQRSQEVLQIPGRNGAIVLPYGAFQNYEQSYQAFLDAKYIGGLEQVMPRVVDWLLGNEGYHKLEDSYFPNTYRMAYYSGGAEFVSIFNEYGEGTLTFNCAPERYFKSGDFNQTLTNGIVLKNPTSFPARPTLRVVPTTASSNGDVILAFSTPGILNTVIAATNRTAAQLILTTSTYKSDNNIDNVPSNVRPYINELVSELRLFKILSDAFTTGTVGIDMKEHSAFHGSNNLNKYIVGTYEDMTLTKETQINWYGNAQSIIMQPRWWTI